MKSNTAVLALITLALAACNREAPPAPATTPAASPGATATAPAPAAPSAAKPATSPFASTHPVLQVTTTQGEKYDLAQHRGKWVVVNFWATWCGPCLKEMPELSALDAMREHVEVIGLAYEEIEPAEMSSFLKAHPVAYPIAVLDVNAPPSDFGAPVGLPTTYLIGPDGAIAHKFMGPISAADVEREIAKAGGPKEAT